MIDDVLSSQVVLTTVLTDDFELGCLVFLGLLLD